MDAAVLPERWSTSARATCRARSTRRRSTRTTCPTRSYPRQSQPGVVAAESRISAEVAGRSSSGAATGCAAAGPGSTGACWRWRAIPRAASAKPPPRPASRSRPPRRCPERRGGATAKPSATTPPRCATLVAALDAARRAAGCSPARFGSRARAGEARSRCAAARGRRAGRRAKRGRAGDERTRAAAARGGRALGELRASRRRALPARRGSRLRASSPQPARARSPPREAHAARCCRAELDPLTGLANHGQLLGRARARGSRTPRATAARSRSSCSTSTASRRWNDRHGHRRGRRARSPAPRA